MEVHLFLIGDYFENRIPFILNRIPFIPNRILFIPRIKPFIPIFELLLLQFESLFELEVIGGITHQSLELTSFCLP